MPNKRYSQIELRKQDAIGRHLILSNAPLLKEEFPSVREIIIKYKRQSRSSVSLIDKEWCVKRINPNDKFHIFISCINDTCTEGGFDLTSDIRSLIKSKSHSYNREESLCEGKEHFLENAPSYICHSKIEYEITIHYQEEGQEESS